MLFRIVTKTNDDLVLNIDQDVDILDDQIDLTRVKVEIFLEKKNRNFKLGTAETIKTCRV